MKNLIYKFIILSTLFFALSSFVFSQSVVSQLESLSRVKEVKSLKSSTFKEKYLLTFEQPIDHQNLDLGTFTQRVFVCHVHPDSATVLVTEGYGAQYAAREGYIEELSKLFNTNIVVVEHRYFLNSTPRDLNWSYLTTKNSAEDLHDVVTTLKSIYGKKWISTGISKGGQTTTLYRTYFPNDVDISVPYVAPLCRDVEDGRHERFLADSVGTPEQRERIKEFQIEVLKRKKTILPLMDSVIRANSYQYNIPIKEVYDYCVLEFPFALWQWGTSTSIIPSLKATDREYFNCLMTISGPDYFINNSPTASFFVQAAKELGYYGYDTKPFKKYLDIKSAKGYLERIFLPKGWDFKFDDSLYKKISHFIKTTDSKMLFIYGQYDPWSAPRVLSPGNENIKIFIQPNGSHRARISTFDCCTKDEIINILKSWLYN